MFWVTVVGLTSLFLAGDCMYFWHGASTLEATFQICAHGFDGKYSRNGNNRYGVGVYAASFDNWQYSLDHFSTPCFLGVRVMLLCKGLVNKQKMSAGLTCDDFVPAGCVGVDNVKNARIFAFGSNYDIIPTHLVEFKSRCQLI